MKKFLKILLILFFLSCISYAIDNPILKSYKTFDKNAETVFLNSYSAIMMNNFEIKEVASYKGYILFNANKTEYLLSVSKDGSKSIVKITPSNLDYASSSYLFDMIFKSLEGI